MKKISKIIGILGCVLVGILPVQNLKADSRQFFKTQYLTTDSVPASSWLLASQNMNETTIYNFLRNTLGFNIAASCGILANIEAESNFNPNSLNPRDSGNTESFGICQWNSGKPAGDRYGKLKTWCANNGFPGEGYKTLNAQLHYMKYELESSAYYKYAELKNIPDTADGAYEASKIWSRFYEGCASVYYEPRANSAKTKFWPKYSPSPTPQSFHCNLESPVRDGNYNGNVLIGGWALLENGVTNVTAWINGQAMDCPLNQNRSDVREACPGYSNCYGREGFSVIIPPKYLKNGQNSLSIFAYHDTETHNIAELTFTYTDNEAPIISDIKISDESEDGYTVSCIVKDNVQVDRVQFPTWTVYNDQDDLLGKEDASWQTLSAYRGKQDGDKYTYRVNKSDHNNETGEYITDIYAYDAVGNVSVERVKRTLHIHDYQIKDIVETTCNQLGYKEYTCSCGDTYKEYDKAEYTEWLPEKRQDGETQGEEKKEQYRYKKYETKEVNNPSELSGNDWKQIASNTSWTNYGAWSGWQDNAVSSSDTTQVETRTVYRYYYFLCPICNGHEPFWGQQSDCHQYTLKLTDGVTGWFTTPYSQCNGQSYSYTQSKMYTESLGDGQRWNFNRSNITNASPGTTDDDNVTVLVKNQYRYRSRSQVTKYTYRRMSGYSDWTDKETDIPVGAEKESRTVYRYVASGLKEHVEEIRDAKEATEYEEGYTGDTYCKVCGAKLKDGEIIPKKQDPIIPDPGIESDVKITVSTVTGRAGTEVIVPVTITKNPGIAGFSYDVNYDAKVLTLKSVEKGALCETGQLSANGNVFNWYTDENILGDGTICNLVFTINKDASVGSTAVSISLHDGKKNLVNENSEYVDAAYTAGMVQVTRGMVGDINGDGEITIGDVVMLNRYVLGKVNLSAEVTALADTNGDHDVTIGDVVLLNRYVLGKVEKLGGSKTQATNSVASASMRMAAGEEGLTVVAGNVTVKPGEKISVPVELKNNPGIAGFAFTVNLPEGISVESMTAGDVLSGGTFTPDGQKCTWYVADNMTREGSLFTLNLVAGENAKSGEVSIELLNGKANNLSDEDGMTVPVSFIAGTITVERETVCEHKGGVATCVAKAICEECGEAYGEVDPANHTGETELRNVKEATEAETGYTGDKYCKDCGTLLEKGIATEKLEKESEPTPQPVTEKPQPESEPVMTKLAVGTVAEVNGAKYQVVMTGGKEGVALVTAGKNVQKIPATVDISGQTYAVTVIGDRAFYKNKKLKTVNIPNTVVSIGKSAFQGCVNLKKVTIGKSVQEIGKCAFQGCKKLKSVKVNTKSLRNVGKKAFSGTDKKLVIKVPKKNKKNYVKMFKKTGMKKTSKVK